MLTRCKNHTSTSQTDGQTTELSHHCAVRSIAR